MNLARLHAQATLRILPLFLVVGALNAGMLSGLLVARGAWRATPLQAGAVAALAWTSIALYLGTGLLRQRASAFELALPVTARRLWLAHVFSTLAVAIVLAATTVWVATAQAHLVGARGALPLGAAPLTSLLVGASILCLGVLELPKRALHRVPLTGRTVSWTLSVLAAVALLLVPLARFGVWGAGLLAALGVFLLWTVWRGVPLAYTLQTRMAAAAAPAAAGAHQQAQPAAHRSRHLVRWTIARSVALTPKDAMAYPLLLLFGLVLGGTLTLWTGDADMEDLRFFYIPMATYVLFALTGPRLAFLHYLDPLPIARWRVLAWLLVPHLGCFVLGYGAGALLSRVRAPAQELVQMVESGDSWRVWVPLWAREISWDGKLPDIAASTGETHAPRGLPLWPRARVVIYSPYDTPAGSSLGYVAEQLSRATAALYGREIPAAELAARYLEVHPDGSVGPKPGGLRLQADYPDLHPRPAGPLLPFFVTLVAVPWLVLVAVLFRTYRPDIGPERGQQFVWGIIALFVVVTVVLAVLVVRHAFHPWATRAVLGIAAHRLGASAAGVAATWVAAAVLLALGYALVQRQFRRMEVPARPLRFGLVNFSRDEG